MRYPKQAFAEAAVENLRREGVAARWEFSPRHGADDMPYLVSTSRERDQKDTDSVD